MKKNLTKLLAWGILPSEWQEVCRDLKQPQFRAKQIWQGLYCQFWDSWDKFTVLPEEFRQKLAERFVIDAVSLVEAPTTSDRVKKLLLGCCDGELIESVMIPTTTRMTLCVSSQAGCAFGCAFCASGANGLSRNLDAGEIVGQVMAAARIMRENSPPQNSARPGNIVVMGMGEPFANYDNLMHAIRIINDPDGLKIGARHITVSTCGVVPGIKQLANEGMQIELSVSLHASNDALRTRLMPVNKKWPIKELLEACRDYTAQTGRIITFEYTLIRGINDTPQHARELVEWLRPLHCRINLIPLSRTFAIRL